MFSRTLSGIKNTDLFYSEEYLVFVEGKDDIPFWGIFFPVEIGNYKCKLKSVDGGEIKKYVDLIYKGEAKFLVALDSDYRMFMNEIHEHDQIIETLSHSIENVIISPKTLYKIICIESRQDDYDITFVTKWLEHFNKFSHSLMVADYLIKINHCDKKGLDNNCLRFLVNQKHKTPVFDYDRIQDYIEDLELSEEEFNLAKECLESHKPSHHIKGHFFFNSSLCFLNHEVNRLGPKKKVKRSIGNEDFYTMLIFACRESVTTCPTLQEFQHKAVEMAKKFVNESF